MNVRRFIRGPMGFVLVAVFMSRLVIAESQVDLQEAILEIRQLEITDESGKSITLHFNRPILVDLHSGDRDSLAKIIDFDPGAMIKMHSHEQGEEGDNDMGMGQGVDAVFSSSGTINLHGQLRVIDDYQNELIENSVCLKVKSEVLSPLEGFEENSCDDIN